MRLLLIALLIVLPLSGQTSVKKRVKPAAGKQVTESPAIAELRAKAQAGDGEAQFELGFAYSAGKDVPKNEVEA